MEPTIRPLTERDLDAADHIMRVAFGTFLGVPDPPTFFGDAQFVRTRFRAAPENAWAAELDGRVVGSVFAARWGSFGWLGPLTTHPDVWDTGVGGLLVGPVLAALDRWEVSQGALFTFPDSLKHIGLYQRRGFWPRFLVALLAKPVAPVDAAYETFAGAADSIAALDEIRELTGTVFPGLELDVEVLSCAAQRLGDTVLVRRDGRLEGFAVCHTGAGSEGGSGDCFVKFGAVPRGPEAPARFAALLDACEAYAGSAGATRLTAGVNTGRLDAYRLLLERGFRATRMGLSMLLRPEEPSFDGPEQYVIDDLR